MAQAAKKGRRIAVAAKRSAPARSVSAPAPAEVEFEAAAPVENIQRNFRGALERGAAESQLVFARARTAADETASAFELSFAAAKDGALAINAKAFESLRANADANFDFLKAIWAARSLSDVVTLQAEFARKQVETMTSQTKDLGALTQKAVTETVGPIREQVAKSFRIAI